MIEGADVDVDALIRTLASQIGPTPSDCKLIQGTIISLEGDTCTVIPAESTKPAAGWRWLADSYSPWVGDVVWILDGGGPGAKFILGTTGTRNSTFFPQALLNGWSNDTGVAAAKLLNGRLWLTGVIKRVAGAPAYPSTIFNVGINAPFYQNHPIAVSGGLASVFYDTTGAIGIWSVSGNPHLDAWLDGLSFRIT